MSIGKTILKMQKDPRLTVSCSNLIDNNTYIGVEIELENLLVTKSMLTDSLTYWNIHKENSIRGDGAYELVFKIPLAGKDVVEALNELNRFIDSLSPNKRPKKSDRQSVHVHLDIREFSFEEFISLIYVYCLLERSLYRYCSKEFNRFENPFCVPLYEWETYMYILDQLYGFYLYKTSSQEDVLQAISSVGRYSGLNLNSMIKFGTVEFRMHGPEWEKEPIIKWINIILKLKQMAKYISSNYFAAISNTYLLQTLDYYTSLYVMKNKLKEFAFLVDYPGSREDLKKGLDVVHYLDIKRRSSVEGPILERRNKFYFALGHRLFDKFVAKNSIKPVTKSTYSTSKPKKAFNTFQQNSLSSFIANDEIDVNPFPSQP